jgi:LmbE family N-acetylglucosaminyl deacetylase
MFIFGHYDDDSAISGTINMFVRAGWEVHSVYTTSAGTGSVLWGTTTARKAEMQKSVDFEGVPRPNRHILNVPDSEAVKNLPRIMDEVTALVIKYKPSLIITLAYEGGHWDHDSSCVAGYVAWKRSGLDITRYEVPTYNAAGPKIQPYQMNHFIKAWGPTQYVIPDREAWKVRREVRYAYKSQWFLMLPEGLIFAYRHMLGRGEPIRKTPDYNFLEPPHPGTEMVSTKAGALPGHPFSEWHDAVASIPEFSQK